MPIIGFTAASALQTTVVTAAIYPCVITKIEGPKASASQKSVSYFVDIAIADGKHKGKERTIVFNTATSSPSLLGNLQYFPDYYLLQLDKAINGREIEVADYQMDTDNLLDKPFDAKWGVEMVNGSPTNTVTEFYPSGYGAKAPTF